MPIRERSTRWVLFTSMVVASTVTGCVSLETAETIPPPAFYARHNPNKRPPLSTSKSYTRKRPIIQPSRPIGPARHHEEWLPVGRRISPRWTTIVLHHSATQRGGAKSFDKFHREARGWDELGYHFVIGNGTDTRDGLVEVGSRWQKQKTGAHCKTAGNYHNKHGIGICLVGDFTKSKPTPKQLASLSELLRFLCAESGISANMITSHGLVDPKTRCPGKHFPMLSIRKSVLPRVATLSQP